MEESPEVASCIGTPIPIGAVLAFDTAAQQGGVASSLDSAEQLVTPTSGSKTPPCLSYNRLSPTIHIKGRKGHSLCTLRVQGGLPNLLEMDAELSQESDPTTAEPRQRRVEVVTVPAKTIGRVQRAGLRLATWLFGSPLTWAMHWAIRVEGIYFELHRPGGVAKPRLRTSTWSEERERDIIATVPIGSTALSDEEIVGLSMASCRFPGCTTLGFVQC